MRRSLTSTAALAWPRRNRFVESLYLPKPDYCLARRMESIAQPNPRKYDVGLLAIIALVPLVYVATRLTLSFSRGFDITDEAFYVLHFKYWDTFGGNLSYFGAYLSPLYSVLGSDILLMRVAGAVLIALSLFALAYQTTVFVNPCAPRSNRLFAGAIAATFSCGFYVQFSTLVTPSYNLLNLCFIAGSTTCAATLAKGMSKSLLNPIYLAYGALVGMMVFNKATSALACVLVHCIFFFSVSFRQGIRTAAWSAAAVVLGISVNYAYFEWRLGHPLYLAILNDLALAQKLGPIGLPNTWHSLLKENFALLFSGGAYPATAIALAWCALAIIGCVKPIRTLTFVGGLGIYGAGLWLAMKSDAPVSLLNHLYVSVAGLCLVLVASDRFGLKRLDTGQTRVRSTAAAAVVLALPVCFGIGSGNGIVPMAIAALPLVATGLTALSCAQVRVPQFLATVGVAAIATIAVLMSHFSTRWYSSHNTYRLDSSLSGQVVSYRVDGGHLHLSDKQVTFFSKFRKQLADHGFTPGSALLDLTGRSPGLVLVADAMPLGEAWLLGGYSGSSAYVSSVLADIPLEKLNGAWLLTSDNQASRIEWRSILTERFSGKFPFVRVASIVSTDGERIDLWRPALFSRDGATTVR
jgi:hypothetical protein